LQPKAPAETPVASDASAPVTTPQVSEKTTDKTPAPPRPAGTADPLGDLAKSKSGLNSPAAPADASDPFDYVVQVGAYRTSADADAQKAKLALLGLDAKVSERDQAGRVVYRVRLGPFSDKNAAERIRAQLESNGIDNTLVRVQR